MTTKLGKLLGRSAEGTEKETIGEDMVPSPDALAQRSALSDATDFSHPKSSTGPFSSIARAPVRDFTG